MNNRSKRLQIKRNKKLKVEIKIIKRNVFTLFSHTFNVRFKGGAFALHKERAELLSFSGHGHFRYAMKRSEYRGYILERKRYSLIIHSVGTSRARLLVCIFRGVGGLFRTVRLNKSLSHLLRSSREF